MLSWFIASVGVRAAAATDVELSVVRQPVHHLGGFVDVRVALAMPRDVDITLQASGNTMPTVVTFRGGQTHATVPVLVGNNPPSDRITATVGGRAAKYVWLPAPATDEHSFTTDDVAPVGPRAYLGIAGAYAPAHGWKPGAPALERRQAVLAGILISLASLSTTLVRSRRAQGIALLAVVLLSVAAIATWRACTSPLRFASGEVTVHRRQTLQTDRWRYVTSRAPSHDVAIELADREFPALADEAHARALRATLHVDALYGRRSLRCDLRPGAVVAFMSRRMESSSVEAAAPGSAEPSDVPMSRIARQLYALQGDHIVTVERGYVSDDWWGAVQVIPSSR
jgi:hypothetical protein